MENRKIKKIIPPVKIEIGAKVCWEVSPGSIIDNVEIIKLWTDRHNINKGRLKFHTGRTYDAKVSEIEKWNQERIIYILPDGFEI